MHISEHQMYIFVIYIFYLFMLSGNYFHTFSVNK